MSRASGFEELERPDRQCQQEGSVTPPTCRLFCCPVSRADNKTKATAMVAIVADETWQFGGGSSIAKCHDRVSVPQEMLLCQKCPRAKRHERPKSSPRRRSTKRSRQRGVTVAIISGTGNSSQEIVLLFRYRPSDAGILSSTSRTSQHAERIQWVN